MRICVFCGSRDGAAPVYLRAATDLGTALARDGHTLIYGGAKVGTMGAVANAALAGGAQVIGVIPEHLREREVAHETLTTLHVVDGMHARKATMARESDAFISLPGGTGTFEEFFEVWTWQQIGLHAKPCALLNINGYYDGLLAFLAHTVTEGFSRADVVESLIVEHDIATVLGRVARFQPGPTRWSRA
jgi:uncharacterized protein (TIGR00730 family)